MEDLQTFAHSLKMLLRVNDVDAIYMRGKYVIGDILYNSN